MDHLWLLPWLCSIQCSWPICSMAACMLMLKIAHSHECIAHDDLNVLYVLRYKWDFDFILNWLRRENAALLLLHHRFSLQLNAFKFRDVSLQNVQNDENIYGNRIFISNVESFNHTHTLLVTYTLTHSLLTLMAIN